MRTDSEYMREAIRLALRGSGTTSPNPMVGAILVRRGRIVGRGFHRRAGEAHAEVHALRAAGRRAAGGTLYVTLEPCDHYGRTPPCTDAIIAAGVRRVVMAMRDPNPLTAGRGMRRLKDAGIAVTCGVLADEAAAINKPYLKWVTTQLPYVTVKLAESIDGKIATASGDARWISSPRSRQLVHRLRGRVDAIMVGARTITADDPQLTNRSGSGKQPARIIVDGALTTSITARIFRTVRQSPVIIATTNRRRAHAARYERRGAEVIAVPARHGTLDLAALLRILATRGMTHVLVEGGGTLAGNLADARLVDEWLFFVAPIIIGGTAAVSAVGGRGAYRVQNAIVLHNLSVTPIGKDLLVRGESAKCLPVSSRK